MSTSLLASRAESLNTKVGVVTLGVAAFMTLLPSHFSLPLAPMRLFTIAIAVWLLWRGHIKATVVSR